MSSAFASVDLLEAYFATRGFRIEKFVMQKSKYTKFVSPYGPSWLVRNAFVDYPFVRQRSQMIASRKDLAYQLSDSHGVRTPKTFVVSGEVSIRSLEDYLQYAPLVVKPLDSSMSRGVTLEISDVQTLHKAIAEARQYSSVTLVQEQIEGDEIRFVVADGKVEAALLRQTPRLIGDGVHSLEQLLAEENAERNRLKMPYLVYPELSLALLQSQGISPAHVPAENQIVELGRGTMIKTGASVYEIKDKVHVSYIKDAEKLAKGLGARFIVVDMLVTDYTRPKSPDNYAFLEFNTAPALKLFYSCRDSNHYDVLRRLGPMIEESLQNSR